MFNMDGVTQDQMRARLFPFLLLGEALQWFYSQPAETVQDWNALMRAFMKEYYSLGKTQSLHNKIASFDQYPTETISEVFERFNEYTQAVPHHKFLKEDLVQKFYQGLTMASRTIIDASGGGSIIELMPTQAFSLLKKVADNDMWVLSGCLLPVQPAGNVKRVLQVEKEDILEGKIDLLMQRLEKMEIEEKEAQDLKAAEARSTCEECREYGHVHKDCPEEAKVLDYMRKGDLPNFHYRQGRPQFNASSSILNSALLRIQLKDFMDEQAKINKDTITKFKDIDKVLENIDSKVTEVGSSNHEVLNMMKMLETQVGQLAGRLSANEGKLPDNLKVQKWRRILRAIQERRSKSQNIPREQGSLNHPQRRRSLLRRKLRRLSLKSPNWRCWGKTRRYCDSSHATFEVSLIITLKSLWSLCVDLASTCRYWMPFKFLHILITSKAFHQVVGIQGRGLDVCSPWGMSKVRWCRKSLSPWRDDADRLEIKVQGIDSVVLLEAASRFTCLRTQFSGAQVFLVLLVFGVGVAMSFMVWWRRPGAESSASRLDAGVHNLSRLWLLLYSRTAATATKLGTGDQERRCSRRRRWRLTRWLLRGAALDSWMVVTSARGCRDAQRRAKSRGAVAQGKRRGAAARDFISRGLGFGAVCRVKRAAMILDVRALDVWRASGHGTGALADPFCGTATGKGERGRGTASAPREGYA
jgi:hypothetical protein